MSWGLNYGSEFWGYPPLVKLFFTNKIIPGGGLGIRLSLGFRFGLFRVGVRDWVRVSHLNRLMPFLRAFSFT